MRLYHWLASSASGGSGLSGPHLRGWRGVWHVDAIRVGGQASKGWSADTPNESDVAEIGLSIVVSQGVCVCVCVCRFLGLSGPERCVSSGGGFHHSHSHTAIPRSGPPVHTGHAPTAMAPNAPAAGPAAASGMQEVLLRVSASVTAKLS